MHVFVTGASGFIGRAVVAELLASGHEVTGLARSPESASVVTGLGARVHRGHLDDLDSIRAGARGSNRAERAAVATIADALAGSDRPFVLASGLALPALGRAATERDINPAVGPDAPRGGSENLALGYAENGVRVVSVRFAPTVHGEGDHGFVAVVARTARERGAAVYPGDGRNRWAAVHRLDAARLVRLGLEKATAGTILHAVAEEGVPVRRIVEALAERLAVPATSVTAAELAAQIPFIGGVLGADMAADSTITRELLDWRPAGATLLEDIAAGHYDQP
ncbi:NAD-dependent epimerase/dehydratase family protein [Nocardia farcinica]|uniref:NAD-dependent epimerase/dehydratase family protein n=1 Tax=Nocardia farcinica TaxID=37329 RepID=UPI001894039C|nr:NAD-dependent epimerase/dehydratase family protein [Nocardia farcinica]MBF6294711.1 NAD-dependent epimerase/dehydratase family protein [Nocardia farcinica]MBF6380826.1 NAD-dependent epimerase/dehydratase family protein [Nocardia farcinica]MBF6421446.1 NAD-dependent epimerase/dehydratase family protein [Nocardia farcinica]MBF6433103.1 NAD-dependent epimerase/dehydratase family protein [Nocardia farcinica]MBF6503921.1 NAD-dependent epimerase/dehydratase family protein [Nocardia farcinica]